jgi:hypothetical protein
VGSNSTGAHSVGESNHPEDQDLSSHGPSYDGRLRGLTAAGYYAGDSHQTLGEREQLFGSHDNDEDPEGKTCQGLGEDKHSGDYSGYTVRDPRGRERDYPGI